MNRVANLAASDSALESLLKTQPSLWRGHEQHRQQETISTGFADLDRALPGNGWSPGTLTELLARHEGTGELSLLLPTLKNITQQRQWVAMVNPPHIPYAPALANAGIELDRMLIVDTDNQKDTLWSTEQLLRAGTFTVVICWLGKTGTSPQRRLQLAAETGRALAIAYRPSSTAKDPSAAALRISLTARLNGSAAGPKNNPKHNPKNNPDNHSENHPGNGMLLNILKSRGGKNQSVFIRADDFDQSQGVEWPGLNATTELPDNHSSNSHDNRSDCKSDFT